MDEHLKKTLTVRLFRESEDGSRGPLILYVVVVIEKVLKVF